MPTDDKTNPKADDAKTPKGTDGDNTYGATGAQKWVAAVMEVLQRCGVTLPTNRNALAELEGTLEMEFISLEMHGVVADKNPADDPLDKATESPVTVQMSLAGRLNALVATGRATQAEARALNTSGGVTRLSLGDDVLAFIAARERRPPNSAYRAAKPLTTEQVKAAAKFAGGGKRPA